MKKGFTLIEILVAITLLGVLIGVFITILDPIEQIRKARDAQRKSDLRQLQGALENYYADNGQYPPSEAPGYHKITPVICFGDSWPPYAKYLPKDPTANSGSCDAPRHYQYIPKIINGSPQGYCLYANLEGKNDPQACNGGTRCSELVAEAATYTPANVHCGQDAAHPCNYRLCLNAP